jgi:hypothetical protein
VPAFLDAKRNNSPVFHAFESHWTALGMEVAGRVIAERIGPLLPALHLEPHISYCINDTVLKAKGDLIGRICDDERYIWYSLPVKRVLCTDGSLYCDDRKSKIMILGDSYVNHGKWWNAYRRTNSPVPRLSDTNLFQPAGEYRGSLHVQPQPEDVS